MTSEDISAKAEQFLNKRLRPVGLDDVYDAYIAGFNHAMNIFKAIADKAEEDAFNAGRETKKDDFYQDKIVYTNFKAYKNPTK